MQAAGWLRPVAWAADADVGGADLGAWFPAALDVGAYILWVALAVARRWDPSMGAVAGWAAAAPLPPLLDAAGAAAAAALLQRLGHLLCLPAPPPPRWA